MPLNCQDIEYGGNEKASHVDRALFLWAGVYGIYHGVSMTYTGLYSLERRGLCQEERFEPQILFKNYESRSDLILFFASLFYYY